MDRLGMVCTEKRFRTGRSFYNNLGKQIPIINYESHEDFTADSHPVMLDIAVFSRGQNPDLLYSVVRICPNDCGRRVRTQ